MSSALLDFRPDENQQLLLDMTDRYASETLAQVAASADEKQELPQDACATIHSFGLATMPVPESLGGIGMPTNLTTHALIIESLARGDASSAVAGLSPLSLVNVIVQFGSDEQQARWLPKLAGEQHARCGLAIGESFDHLQKLQTMLTGSASDGYELSGTKRLVADGCDADYLLILAQNGAEYALIVLDREQMQGSSQIETDLDSAMGFNAIAFQSVTFDALPVASEDVMVISNTDVWMIQARAMLGIAAVATGVSQAVLDYVKDYVNEREAFGEPISHRQAIAFMVADIAIELEAMRLLLWQTLGRVQQQVIDSNQAITPELLAEVVRTHSHIAEKSMQIGTDGVQLLGGHGFTREHPVERWYRQLRGVANLRNMLIL